MKRLLDILRFTLISPESLVVFIVLALWFFDCRYLIMLAEQIVKNDEIWKYLPTLPFVFSAAIFKMSDKLRAPLENHSNRELYEWPGYKKLVDRVVVSLLISIVCCVLSLIIWFFSKHIPLITLGALYIVSVVVSGLSALLIYLANQILREILELHGSSNR